MDTSANPTASSDVDPRSIRRTSDWLLEYLRCPRCGTVLRMDGDRLDCERRHWWPIIHGIPRFSPQSTYADSFGFEWARFPRVQLDDLGGTPSEATFIAKSGLSPDMVRGKTVLDAGCGMGRFAQVASRWGAACVVGFDLSQSVEVAADNLAQFETVAFVQADLTAPPLRPGSFDIVFSIGVLQHTPSAYRSLASIAPLVKPGGLLAVWVYSQWLRWGLLGGELIRLYTRRLEPDRLLAHVERFAPRLKRLKEAVPALKRPVDFLVPSSNQRDPEWQKLDTFNWYSPRYQSKHTYREVESWFRRLGFEEIARLRTPTGVRGRRPPAAGPASPAA